MGTEDQSGNPEGTSGDGFSSAKEVQGLTPSNEPQMIEMPEWPEADPAAPNNTGPNYVEGKKDEKPIFSGKVMVKRSDGFDDPDWVVESQVPGTDSYVVTRPNPDEKVGGTLEKTVTAAQLDAWQPRFSSGDRLVMPSESPNQGKWFVVGQAADGQVLMLEDLPDPSKRARRRVISAAEASKYKPKPTS